jgi:N-methylhydantoinase B/oxoprolinase/acetone carboxylase alpha subunit
MPDGVYEAESFMDDDGINVGQRVPINVKVIVAGDKMTVDLTGVSKQVQGFYNSGITAGYSCAQVGVQVPDLVARPADQRRPVPRARHRAAARAAWSAR